MLGLLRTRRRMSEKETIAILGGTGDLGTGLALRWAKAGHRLIIGSRVQERALAAAAKLNAKVKPDKGRHPVRAMANTEAASEGDVVVLTVPAEHQVSTLESVRAALKGKILVDTTVPLAHPKIGTVQLPEQGSAGNRAQEFLGPDIMVVSAFQNIAAHLLHSEVHIECDVLVTGNSRRARSRVIELVESAGLRGWHAGPIQNSAASEALTSVLIQINRTRGMSHSGIKVVGQG